MASLSSLLLTPLLLLAGIGAPHKASSPTTASQGIFTGSTDIGHAQRGSSVFNAPHELYELRGGGEDVWGTADDFRFTWTRLTGDASLAADIHIDAPVTYRLAKGMLMFRQSLDPGSPYADVALHADGHITLQYRLTQGGETKDVVLPQNNAGRLRIERHGDTFTAYADTGDRLTSAGPSITLPMHGSIYVGLGVCSHNTDVLQGVDFARVMLVRHPSAD